jgi:hypothetical protein
MIALIIILIIITVAPRVVNLTGPRDRTDRIANNVQQFNGRRRVTRSAECTLITHRVPRNLSARSAIALHRGNVF